MEDNDLNEIRKQLLAKRAELMSEGDVAIVPVQQDGVTKPDEDEAPHAEMDQVIASNRNRARAEALQGIEQALTRIAKNPEDFGLCEGCDEPIPKGRLLLMPQVTLCAACQAEEEAEKGILGQKRRKVTDYR